MEFTYSDVWKFYSCDLCPYKTKSLLPITSHIKQHRTTSNSAFSCDSNIAGIFYKCDICGFETLLKVNLSRHAHIIHKQRQIKYDYLDILKNFVCGNCDFQSHCFLLYTKHAWTCVAKDELAILNILMKSKDPMIHCQLCSFESRNKATMKQHKRILHWKIDPKKAKNEEKIYRLLVSQDEPSKTKHTHFLHSKKDPKNAKKQKSPVAKTEHTHFLHSKGFLKNANKRKSSVTNSITWQEPRVYKIQMATLQNMYVTHQNSFMNKCSNKHNSQGDSSTVCRNNSKQASEIRFIPLKQQDSYTVPQKKPSSKRKKRPQVCTEPVQHLNNTCVTQVEASTNQHLELYPTSVQHQNNTDETQTDASTNRGQHPEICHKPVQHPELYPTSVQHLNNTYGIQADASTNHEQHQVCQITVQHFDISVAQGKVYATPSQNVSNTYGIQANASTDREQYTGVCLITVQQHLEVCSTPVQHLNDACSTLGKASDSTNQKQHPEACQRVIFTNKANISNESLQCTTSCHKSYQINSEPPPCVTDVSKTYQCKNCSFNTQFKILIDYHENVLHRIKKVGWDLVNLFKD